MNVKNGQTIICVNNRVERESSSFSFSLSLDYLSKKKMKKMERKKSEINEFLRQNNEERGGQMEKENCGLSAAVVFTIRTFKSSH